MSSKYNKGEWSEEEQARFLEAIKLYQKDWNLVTKHIGTRSKQQVQSHAQKYQKHLDDIKRRNDLLNYWADASQDRSKRIKRAHKAIDYSRYSGVQKRIKSKALQKTETQAISQTIPNVNTITHRTTTVNKLPISPYFSITSDIRSVPATIATVSGTESYPLVHQYAVSVNQQALLPKNTPQALPGTFLTNASCNAPIYCTSIPMYPVYHYGSMSVPPVFYSGSAVY